MLKLQPSVLHHDGAESRHLQNFSRRIVYFKSTNFGHLLLKHIHWLAKLNTSTFAACGIAELCTTNSMCESCVNLGGHPMLGCRCRFSLIPRRGI
jgi:hypothetical protein